jgi:ribosome-binding protein aMBF1 (putative translation factor)
MIKNERQYRITKAQAAKFEAALKSFLEDSADDQATHPRLIKAQADALQSQCESLQDELREYEKLRSGDVAPPDLGYVFGIPRDIIRARISCGFSQKDLAELLGMAEQQIQRYEATEYESVSLARILEIAETLQAAVHIPLKRTGSGRLR